MTSDLLHTIGEALFGPRWQTSLAAALGVNERTVRRWAAGNNEIPEGARDDIRALVRKRQVELVDILNRV